MNKIDKLNQFQKLLDGIESEIGTFGGRKYLSKDKNYTLNKLISDFNEILADTVFLKSAHDLAKNASVSIAGAPNDRGADVVYTGKIRK